MFAQPACKLVWTTADSHPTPNGHVSDTRTTELPSLFDPAEDVWRIQVPYASFGGEPGHRLDTFEAFTDSCPWISGLYECLIDQDEATGSKASTLP